MGQKPVKELGKEDVLTSAVSDYEILNHSEEEAHSNNPEETDQNFVDLDTSILEPCPQEPTRPDDNNTEPSFNQGGKKISQSYDTDVSQNARKPNPQLSLAGGPCTSEFKTVTSDATATDISTAVDQQQPDKTEGMTNKTHLKDTPNMLEGSCQADSTDDAMTVGKNETQTLVDRHNAMLDTEAMTKMSGNVEIKRKFSLESENANLLERQPFQEIRVSKGKDKEEVQTLSSAKIRKSCEKVCKESAGTVQHKESPYPDRSEYLDKADSLCPETVTTCPPIRQSHSSRPWLRSANKQDNLQEEKNISLDMSTCILKEIPYDASQTHFAATPKENFRKDKRNPTFHTPFWGKEETVDPAWGENEGKDNILHTPFNELCLLKSRMTKFNSNSEIVTEPTNADTVLVPLRIEEDSEQKSLSAFHSDLSQSNTLFHTEKKNYDKGAFTIMEKHSAVMSSESLTESSAKKVLVSNAPHPAKKGVWGADALCVKRDSKSDYQKAVQSKSIKNKKDCDGHHNGRHNTSPLFELSGEKGKIQDVHLRKRVCDPKIYRLDGSEIEVK